MGLLSFSYWLLLTGPRLARRQTTDRTVRELIRSKFSEEFFDAALPHCELQPARSKIQKDRRRRAPNSRGESGPE
jgi:hypothetical protein